MEGYHTFGSFPSLLLPLCAFFLSFLSFSFFFFVVDEVALNFDIKLQVKRNVNRNTFTLKFD